VAEFTLTDTVGVKDGESPFTGVWSSSVRRT